MTPSAFRLVPYKPSLSPWYSIDDQVRFFPDKQTANLESVEVNLSLCNQNGDHFPWLPFLAIGGTTVGVLHCRRQRRSLMEVTKVERESDRNRRKTKGNGLAFTRCSTPVLWQNLYPRPYLFPLAGGILPTRTVTKSATYQYTRCFTLLPYSSEIRVSTWNWGSYGCFLLWTVARLLTAVFATVTQIVMTQEKGFAL